MFLLIGMIRCEPAKRITLEEAMQQPFLKKLKARGVEM